IRYAPIGLHPNVALGRGDDARALRRLEDRRAEQRLERERHTELADRAAPASAAEAYPQIRRRKSERRCGWRRRRPECPHLDLGAIGCPRVDVAFDCEPGTTQKKRCRIPDGLEPRLQIA